MPKAPKAWFITGAGGGRGKAIADEVSRNGDCGFSNNT